MFTEIAEAKKIILIVSGRTVYDFTKIKDLQAFQKEMQDAYNYITTQVAYMIETRAQKVQRGLYGGGRLPAPYVIDKQAGILKQRKLWSISCRELDRIILERLFNLVEHDSDMVERIGDDTQQ